MKRRVLLALSLTICISTVLNAQDWMHRYNGSASMLDEAADVTMLNGRTYVTGSSYNPVTGWDMYVAVLDGTGSELFSRTIDAPGDQKAVKILPVDNDRFTVVGHGASSTGPAELIVHRFSNEGAMLETSNIGLTPGTWLATVKDAIRYSANTVIALVDGVDEQNQQQSIVIAVNNGQVAWGNPYPVLGDAWGTRLFTAGPNIGAIGYYENADIDAYFILYDAQGNLVVDVPIDAGGDDYPSDAAFDQQGNFYIAGWVNIAGTSTPYAVKTDQNGSTIYQNTFPGSTAPGTRIVDLELTGNGEAVYLIRENTIEGYGVRTVKLDDAGTELWNNVEGRTPQAVNEAPLFEGLSAVVVNGTDARLYWMPALDDQLYTDEITYHVYVSETPGGQSFDTPTATVVGQTWYAFSGMEAGKTYYFVVRADDGTSEDDNTREQSGAVVTSLQITTMVLPDAERGTEYNFQLDAENGQEPYTWSIVSGMPPIGIALGSDGLLSGTSNDVADDYTFTVEVEDANQVKAQKEFTLRLIPAPLQIETAFLPNGEPNEPYSETLLASGGTPPYTWSQISGDLPDGLSLDPGGTLDGTPTKIGTFDFRVRVSDALQVEAEEDFTIQIALTEDLIVAKDTTLQAGIYNYRNIRINPGNTLTMNGAVTMTASDSVEVGGTIWSPCHDLLVSGPVMIVTGDIMDTCMAPGDDPGDLTLHATSFMVLGDTTMSPDETNIVSDGNILITEELGVMPDDFIVTPGMQSPSPMDPVGTLTADVLNGRTSSADPLIVEFIARGADPDGGPVTFDLDFGDGNSDTGIIPEDGEIAYIEHTYAVPGDYTATLTVHDDDGASAMIWAKVYVYDEESFDSFGLGVAVDPTSMLIQNEDSVAFNPDIGINIDGEVTSYSWSFGDGNMSTEMDPAHLYAAPGRYEVSLDVVDDSGNTSTASALVYVFDPDSTQAVQGGGNALSKAAAPATPRFIWAARVKGKNFSGYANQWLWIAGWINANSGSDGDSARNGRKGGYNNIRVNGPLNIGPLPGGFGIPPLIGAGNGGNGGAGKMGKGRRSSRGGKGGNGGSTRITAKNLNVSGGTFSTGSGGDGGDATLACNNGKDAFAYGGSGGKPGSTLRLIGTKSCNFSGSVSFVLGKGGDGGDATATACKGNDACPKAEDGGKAIARAGRGNGSPKKAMVLGRPNGLNSITVSGGNGGQGGNATATGGAGGNANCPNTAIGGKGGRSSATAGDGGKSGLRSTRRAMAMNVAAGSFKGGDGGNANSTGGMGGTAVATPSPAKANGCSAPGVDTDATGGEGGKAYGRNGDYGRSRVNGANNDGNPGSVTLGGSDGGDGTATGGDGGDGDSCCPGGPGGKAEAEGGERGDRVARAVHGGAVTNPDAKHGNATAKGGNGGMAGDCCNPPSQGQSGGDGGQAIATALDPNGVYTATGGDGGDGGDGKPAGAGGGGGVASGSQTGNATDGNPGGPGAICKIQQNACIHWDLPLGQINPGTYQVPLYIKGVVSPANLWGYITVNINGTVFNEGLGLLLGQGGQIGIDFTSLTGGTPPVSWPTWYPIEIELEALLQGSNPTAQLQLGGGYNGQPIQDVSGNGGGSPFTLGISAVGSTSGKFDFVGLQSNSDFFLPDMTFCITFEDP